MTARHIHAAHSPDVAGTQQMAGKGLFSPADFENLQFVSKRAHYLEDSFAAREAEASPRAASYGCGDPVFSLQGTIVDWVENYAFTGKRAPRSELVKAQFEPLALFRTHGNASVSAAQWLEATQTWHIAYVRLQRTRPLHKLAEEREKAWKWVTQEAHNVDVWLNVADSLWTDDGGHIPLLVIAAVHDHVRSLRDAIDELLRDAHFQAPTTPFGRRYVI